MERYASYGGSATREAKLQAAQSNDRTKTASEHGLEIGSLFKKSISTNDAIFGFYESQIKAIRSITSSIRSEEEYTALEHLLEKILQHASAISTVMQLIDGSITAQIVEDAEDSGESKEAADVSLQDQLKELSGNPIAMDLWKYMNEHPNPKFHLTNPNGTLKYDSSTLKEGEELRKQLFGRLSKAFLHMQCEQGHHVFFELSSDFGSESETMDFFVGQKTGGSDSLGLNDRDRDRERKTTTRELMTVFRNRDNPIIRKGVVFMKDGKVCEPPWVTHPEKFERYRQQQIAKLTGASGSPTDQHMRMQVLDKKAILQRLHS
ncbi:MAG: hypothetical protein O3A01_00230 [bacterium]|nr:hypothetical protein [bacterium]